MPFARERARSLVTEARRLDQAARALRAEATELRTRAAEASKGLWPSAPPIRKRGLWALEERAEAAERRGQELELEQVRVLHHALELVPEHLEARALLLAHHRRAHAEAEATGDFQAARRHEEALRSHDRNRTYAEYLRGDGRIDVVGPAGAQVWLHRVVERERQLVPEEEGQLLGVAPVLGATIAMGSYLLRAKVEGCPLHEQPIFVDRLDAGPLVDPVGEARPLEPIGPGALGPDECYVPGGWFWSGDRRMGLNVGERRRVWIDGLIVQRFPVTNEEFIRFLDDVAEREGYDAALRFAPRERGAKLGASGPCLYLFRDGRFHLPERDTDGDTIQPRWPVHMVDWFDAEAYARWFSRRTGQSWRLPSELEWEKAARGVDGRDFPSGWHLEPSRVLMRDSHAFRPLPLPVDRMNEDVSPYGVHGMAGGVREWCADVIQMRGAPVDPSGRAVIERPGPPIDRGNPVAALPRVIRGGGWLSAPVECLAAYRQAAIPASRDFTLGFRLVRDSS